MILGLVSLPGIFLCIGWATSVLAVVLGFVGLSAISKGGGRIRGKGLAWTGIISGILAIAVYGAFLAWGVKYTADRPANEVAADKAARATEGMLSISSSKEVGRGETELERQIATEFSEAFSAMHGAFIVREDANEGEDAKVEGKFNAVCDITENGCVLLAKVPEYKNHTKDAKETVAEMAWLAAAGVLESHSDEVPEGTALLVGLKGLALYGSIMTGEVGDVDPTGTATQRSALEGFYLIEAAEEPAPTVEMAAPPTDEEGRPSE